MLYTGGSLPYFVGIEDKENLSGCMFFNRNFPTKRVQVLFSEKELSELPGESSHILKKSNTEILKDQVQHSSMENTVFQTTFARQKF